MTKAAKEFGKRHANFLANTETQNYVNELEAVTGIPDTDLVQAIKGGRAPGTWAHPKLAVFFARWLDVRFAVA
ncbi:KilA-N domain-containing protein [Halomonas sp. SH5A2]|uniref:KilA-N domain-containing protein n=1 Tax=Halomonas sp. SH5A2 TaxID=2749040 RepID=UPI00163FE379|nr:KilA-N domain-containing protein [Halomonas sp. SH5A2]